MSIPHLSISKNCLNRLLAVLAIAILSACGQRDDQLSEREAMIQARESELVNLFAELVETRKFLEKNQSNDLASAKEDTIANSINQCSCDDVNTTLSKPGSPGKMDGKTLLGAIENVYLDPPGLEFSARIDTGARTSSLNALDIVEFERDGKPFVKFKLTHPETGEILELTRRLRRHVRVKERGDREAQRRPVVRMRVILADINEQIDFTLENRSKFRHQVLIGRNLLNDLAIVDVSQKFTAVKTEVPENGDMK